MNTNRIVLNTLISQQDQQNGTSQLKIVESLLQTGITNIELRREYNTNSINELLNLSELREKNRLTFFYSVPDNVFVNGELNLKLLQYIEESQLLGVHYLKMTLGDFDAKNFAAIDQLLSLLPSSIELNIENDQTSSNSDVNKLMSFCKMFEHSNRKVGLVNDLGNWIFTKQNVEEVSKILLPYTRFIHLKSFKLVNGKPETVSFTKGEMDWKKVIALFNSDLPIGIEYPTSISELKTDLTHLN